MANQFDDAVDAVLSSSGADADAALRQLDDSLQQDLQAQTAVLGDTELPPWAQGDSADAAPAVLGDEGGFLGTAQRFIRFYTDALYRELCDADGGCLKAKYSDLISGTDTKEQVKKLTPGVLNALGDDQGKLVSPVTIAATVALWLARSGLEQWCAQKRTPPAGETAAAVT